MVRGGDEVEYVARSFRIAVEHVQNSFDWEDPSPEPNEPLFLIDESLERNVANALGLVRYNIATIFEASRLTISGIRRTPWPFCAPTNRRQPSFSTESAEHIVGL